MWSVLTSVLFLPSCLFVECLVVWIGFLHLNLDVEATRIIWKHLFVESSFLVYPFYPHSSLPSNSSSFHLDYSLQAPTKILKQIQIPVDPSTGFLFVTRHEEFIHNLPKPSQSSGKSDAFWADTAMKALHLILQNLWSPFFCLFVFFCRLYWLKLLECRSLSYSMGAHSFSEQEKVAHFQPLQARLSIW